MLEEAKNTVKDGVGKTVATAEGTAEAAAENPYARKLGRFGYFTKGVLNLLIGALAASAALGIGGGLTDRRGILGLIQAAPFGQYLLIAVMIGALGYGLWSILRGLADVDGKGSDAKGWITRMAFVGVGISYLIFAWFTWDVFSATRSAADGSSPQSLTRSIMEQPFGRWLLIIIGLVIVGVGLFQFYKAVTAKFLERLDLSSLSEQKRSLVTNFGRFGYAARGVIFTVIGYFVTMAAWNFNPNEAKDIDGALAEIASNYGMLFLLAVALGLMAYGIFSMVEARYRLFGKIAPKPKGA